MAMKWPTTPPLNEHVLENLRIRYEATIDNWNFFLDYRHKFFVRYLIVLGAIMFASYQAYGIHPKTTVGFALLISFCSIVALLLDFRTSSVLIAAEIVGKQIEREMYKEKNKKRAKRNKYYFLFTDAQVKAVNKHLERKQVVGFFTALGATYILRLSHGRLLQIVYSLLAVIFFILAIVCLIVDLPVLDTNSSADHSL